jgi:hypothetical protein
MKCFELRCLFKEPLFHFLVIGGALFLLYGWAGNSKSVAGMPDTKIVVTQDNIDQLYDQFSKTWQRPPTNEEQKRLIEDFVRNEIYYREAIAIGLDRDDEVLKRRLRQKMEFIYEDISSMAEPTDDDLNAFMKKHQEKYLADPQMSFRQVYINTDKRGKSAESDARQILSQLAAGADPETLGDNTMQELEVRLSPLWNIRKQFGHDFGNTLLEITPGRWAGPIRSGFGLHLILVKERRGGNLYDLKDVRETVKRDWMVERQKELKDAAYAKIRERYDVEIEKPKNQVTTIFFETDKKMANQ